jgi:AbrB family looped-hinge helix DNA binding protein
MITAKLGDRFQVVIPKTVREALHLRAGDRLEIKIVDGTVVMVPQSSQTAGLFGKHRDVWAGQDAVDYVRNERASWRD